MTKFIVSAALIVTALTGSVLAQGTQCGAGKPACPESAPCCSEYGFCGTGAQFCMGGCNPIWSNALDSCRPMPICQDKTYTFAPNNPTVINATLYDGNSTLHEWTSDAGMPLNTNNNGGELALILTQDGRAPQGTRLSSTEYVLYGTITATVKTGMWNGVVTAFITMSNVRDEIDFEWPGSHVTEVQSNFFFMGKVDYTAGNGATHGNLTDTSQNYHDYTIDWQPDTLTFSIDGQAVRTVNKQDTLVDGVYQYPTTPARVQLSIWPGGLPSSSQGVIDWAGGLIQYNEPEYVANGNQYEALVSKVTVQCSTNSGLQTGPDTVSYMYGANDTSGVPTVYASNHTTLLNSAPSLRVSAWPLAWLALGSAAFML